MTLLPRFLNVLLAAVSCTVLPGCFIQYSAIIKQDATVDPRLEGVWVYQEKSAKEIRTDRDDSDVGVSGYLIFAKVDEDTYKVMAIDRFEKEGDYTTHLLVSSRKHQQHTFLFARLAEHQQKEIDEDGEKKRGRSLENFLVDYEIDSKGQLFLRFLGMEDFEEIEQVHPVRFDPPQGGFEPLTLTGSEEEILKLYSDPKVRAFFTSCGKYHKLQLPKK